ncbi:MAG: DegT/DnrJ/EryC1/StrS family aminotransferase [Rhabdochlamydiaceae bacterium]
MYNGLTQPLYVHTYENFEPGKDQVLYSGPYWNGTELQSAITALTEGRWITSGENVSKFERLFAKKFNVKHALMVNSGSSANLVMIAALKKKYRWKYGENDQVMVSPVGFPTTIAPLVQNGLKPMFVDIEWDTLNFDLNKLKEKITDRTVAIFVSPVLGNPPNMDIIANFANNYGLKLIGDNCDSLGTKWDGHHIGEFYDVWSTSFYPAHHISTGEGGMVCSNDEELIDLARSFAWWGRGCYCVGSANLLPEGTCKERFCCHLKDLPEFENTVIDHKYVFENMGYNLKPLDLQGAIGLEQLKKFDEIESKRKAAFNHICGFIHKRFGGHNAKVVDQLPQADVCWFGVPIICDSKEIKESLVKHFESNKIQTRHYFAGNILAHPAYRTLDNYKHYPNANEVLNKVFFLGVNPNWNDVVFAYIEKVVKKWKI